MINAFVKGQNLRIAQPRVVSDTIDYLEARFVFQTCDWDGLSKWAHFTQGETTYDIRLTDDKIRREDHLNLSAGEWAVYLHATSADGMRITTEEQKITVQKTGVLNGQPLPDFPLSVEEQFDNRISALEAGGVGPGTGGTTDHSKLTNRDKADQHPIKAIAGLQDALDSKQPKGNYATKDEIPSVPDVPSWAMQPNKPEYTASEVGALSAETKIPAKTSDLENDSGFLTEHQDLTPYAKKTDVPSTAAELAAVVPAGLTAEANTQAVLDASYAFAKTRQIAGVYSKPGDVAPWATMQLFDPKNIENVKPEDYVSKNGHYCIRYFTANISERPMFKIKFPAAKQGSVRIISRCYIKKPANNSRLLIWYKDGTNDVVAWSTGETGTKIYTFDTPKEKTIDYLAGNYESNDEAWLDLDTLSVIPLYPVPAPAGGGIDLGITGATVGQIAEIMAVDENGIPTQWKPVDKPSGGGGGGLGPWKRILKQYHPDPVTDKSGTIWTTDDAGDITGFEIVNDEAGEKFSLRELFVFFDGVITSSSKLNLKVSDDHDMLCVNLISGSAYYTSHVAKYGNQYFSEFTEHVATWRAEAKMYRSPIWQLWLPNDYDALTSLKFTFATGAWKKQTGDLFVFGR